MTQTWTFFCSCEKFFLIRAQADFASQLDCIHTANKPFSAQLTHANYPAQTGSHLHSSF
eukprot:SAG11_NODE_1755_length_4311_cov_3.289411_2_plen_59_part_00